MNTEVNRSLTETYKVYIDSRWQATIMIEESSGLLSIQSEYGHFSHYWGTSGRAKGNTFKQELLRFGLDYVQNKLGYNDNLGDWFDFDKTVKEIKRNIVESRKDGSIDSGKARTFWDEINELEEGNTTSEFGSLIYETGLFEGLYSGDYCSIPIITGTHPRLEKFMDLIYPIFKAELAKELTLETT